MARDVSRIDTDFALGFFMADLAEVEFRRGRCRQAKLLMRRVGQAADSIERRLRRFKAKNTAELLQQREDAQAPDIRDTRYFR